MRNKVTYIAVYMDIKRQRARRYAEGLETLLYHLTYALANEGRTEEQFAWVRLIRAIRCKREEHSHATENTVGN